MEKLHSFYDSAHKAVAKLVAARSISEPEWEVDLPSAHGVSFSPPGSLQTSEALRVALDELPRLMPTSAAGKNWKRAYGAVRKLLTFMKKARSSAIGTGAQIEGNALGFWSSQNKARLKLFKILYNQNTEYIVLGMIAAHLMVLIEGSSQGKWKHEWKFGLADTILTSFYTVEMILRVLCLGFVKGPHAYLRNPYNRLDFVIVFDSWIHIAVRFATGSDSFVRIAVLRAFRGLLALKHFTFFAEVLAITSAVRSSVVPLKNVIFVTFFVLVYYALLGIEFLEEALDQRCVRTTDMQLAYPVRYCEVKYPNNGYRCPASQQQKCLVQGNPNWGATNFDQTHYALLSMFQVISLEGWSLIMYSIKDSLGQKSVAYFTTLVVIGTYFLMNLFIAGISGVFLRIRTEHQMLLKRSHQRSTTFFSATVMANILKDDIRKDDERKWHYRFINRSARVLSRTESSLRAAASSFRLERLSSRSRAVSRSMEIGSNAAASVSDKATQVVEYRHFNHGVLLAVSVNIILLCLYKQGMRSDFVYTLYSIEAVLLIAFIVEMVLRLLASGPASFVADRMNVFDVFIIAISSAALISRAYPNVSSARILRWFYLSKRHVQKSPSTVATCMESVGSLFSVFFFFVFVIGLFSIVSMELYGGQYSGFSDNQGRVRANHDTIMQTMLLWFSVSTGESWVNQMWNSMRPGVKFNWLAPFLYVFYYCMTTYVLLNLIIAVILEKSELNDNEKKKMQRAEHMKLIRRMQSRAYTRSGSWVVEAMEGAQTGLRNLVRVFSQRGSKTKSSENKDGLHVSGEASSSTGVTNGVTRQQVSQVLETYGFPRDFIKERKRSSTTALENAVLSLAGLNTTRTLSNSPTFGRRSNKKKSFVLSEFEEARKSVTSLQRPWYLGEGSLFMFRSNNRFRHLCKVVVVSKYWWWFLMIWIKISIWTVLDMAPPFGDPRIMKSVMRVCDKLVFVVFMIDLILQAVIQGLIFSPDAYLSNLYSVLDVFMLIIDGLNLVVWSENSGRAIHALVALRPFRLVCRVAGLKTLLSTLFSTIPAVTSVLLFSFAIFTIFGSIGVQLFRGRLKFCNDLSISHRAYCSGNYVNRVGILAPRQWANPTFHFDDIQNALLSLFITSTFDNWLGNWLYPMMDITKEDVQPSRNKHPSYAIFMVVFVCIGGFFIVRIFIGVFINEFGVRSGSKLLTERQKLWRDMNRIIQKMKPVVVSRPPQNRVRHFCHRVIYHRWYHSVMVVVICSYTIFLSSHFAHQPFWLSRRRQRAHVGFTTFYMLEVVFKLLGNEMSVYRHDHVAHMELLISCLASSCLLARGTTKKGTVGRVAYTSRLFCLLSHLPRVRMLMRTLFACLPSMAEIMGLLMISLFAFAGVGFQMFSQIKEGSCISPATNFRSFIDSFITVFQVTTADNWSCILNDARVTPPFCTKGLSMTSGDCGYPIAGVVYFVVLIVLANQIFMNLFVAIILDAITFGLVSENALITPEHLGKYKTVWCTFDPRATGFIGIHKLRAFVKALGAPLGYRRLAVSEWYARIEYEVLSFWIPGKGVPFKQLLETLTVYKIGPKGLPIALRIEREKQIQGVYRQGAAIKMQAAIRGHLTRKRLQRHARAEESSKKYPQQFF